MSGHCRHCVEGCTSVSGVWDHTAQRQPTTYPPTGSYVVWQDGHCPMCAEADRIADAIQRDADRADEHTHHLLARIADRIRRGVA